jgi:hypothetical protein
MKTLFTIKTRPQVSSTDAAAVFLDGSLFAAAGAQSSPEVGAAPTSVSDTVGTAVGAGLFNILQRNSK